MLMRVFNLVLLKYFLLKFLLILIFLILLIRLGRAAMLPDPAIDLNIAAGLFSRPRFSGLKPTR